MSNAHSDLWLLTFSHDRSGLASRLFDTSGTNHSARTGTARPALVVPVALPPDRETDYTPLSTAGVKKGWSDTSTPPTCLNAVHMDNLSF